MKRFALFLLMMTLALTGCSGGGEAVATSDQTAAAPESETTEAVETTAVPETTVSPAVEAIDPTKEYRVLFVGNSHTYYNDMPALFQRILQQSGYKVRASSVTSGGWTLQQHASLEDQYGKKVDAELKKGTYDFVVLQDNGSQPITEPALFYDAVRNLAARVREAGAEPILYQTYSRKDGHSSLKQYNMTYESMTFTTAACYAAIGEELSIAVAPVGFAYYDVYTAAGNPLELYDADLLHPSEAGSHLTALTIMTKLFGIDPTALTIRGLDADVAKIVTEAAKKAVFETPEIPDEYKTSSVGVVSK